MTVIRKCPICGYKMSDVGDYALWSQPLLPLWQRVLLAPLYGIYIMYLCISGKEVDLYVRR